MGGQFFFFWPCPPPPPLMHASGQQFLARAVESRELEPFMFGTRPRDKTFESPKCRSA